MHIKKALLQYKPILTVKTCASKHLSYLKISNAMEMWKLKIFFIKIYSSESSYTYIDHTYIHLIQAQAHTGYIYATTASPQVLSIPPSQARHAKPFKFNLNHFGECNRDISHGALPKSHITGRGVISFASFCTDALPGIIWHTLFVYASECCLREITH